MKPDVTAVMRELIREVRQTLPFDLTEEQMCAGPCDGCSMKLLGYLESELEHWERRLDDGEQPGLAELSKLIRTSRKVRDAIARNGLIELEGRIG